jgi:hypothetical protein
MTLQESKRFPKTYGDFSMQSSDGIVFYFPRSLLAYMSPVFDDMFSLGSGVRRGERTETGPPLEISESSAALEHFLCHLDPKITHSSIDEATIGQVLELARKYQVQSIFDWFEKEVVNLRGPVFSPGGASSLLMTNPSLVLHLAATYGLPQTAQSACKFLAGCDVSLLDCEYSGIDLKIYIYVSNLRLSRISRYKGYIQHLAGRKKWSLLDAA